MADRAQRIARARQIQIMELPLASPDQPSQALVIGVSSYESLGDLPPTRDVQGMHDVLASPDYCAYPPDRVKVLEQAQATRAGIIAALEALGDAAKAASSRTFFYFSGHGGQGPDGSSYIIPFDARKGEYPTTGISAGELSRLLDRCEGEVTVVLDCCYSAGMAGHKASPDTPGSPEAPGVDLTQFGDSFRNDIQSRGRVIFAACRPHDMAYGAMVAPYGMFTGYLLDGLRGKASTDGFDVTVHQLFDYVQKQVVSSSMNMQQPSFIANIEQFYRLTRYPQRIAPSVVFEKDVYISYDRKDLAQRNWVERELQPELESNGRSIWDYDELGQRQLGAQEAIKKSKYIIVLLTESYLRNTLEEFNATMGILQALHTHTPRFIPILRERCDVPLAIEAFVGLDMSDWNQMDFRRSMDRLIKRLKKEPHER